MDTVTALYLDRARQQTAVAQHAHLQQPLDQLLENSGDLAIDTAGALNALAGAARHGGQHDFADHLTGLADQLVAHAAGVVEAADHVTARQHELDAELDAALDTALANALRQRDITA